MFVVIGTTTVDLIVSGIDHMPRIDGDEFTNSSLTFCSVPLKMALGGNGANSAYVLATLGAQVALCSAAGQDFFGDRMAAWLSEKGVDLRSFVRSTDHGTATNTTLMDDQHNRLSFYHPGYQHEIPYDKLTHAIFEGVSTLLITGYALMPGLRPDGYASALQTARNQGARTALDIGPALGTPATLDEIRPLLPLTDYLLMNERELAICVGSTNPTSLLEAGAGAVVVKRGADGAALYRVNEAPIETAGFPAQAENTIGAGDSFNSSFLFALSTGKSPSEALPFACAAASMVVASGVGVLGTPTPAAIEAFLHQHHL